MQGAGPHCPRCSAGQENTRKLCHQDKCCYFPSVSRGDTYHFLFRTVYNDIGNLKHEIEKKHNKKIIICLLPEWFSSLSPFFLSHAHPFLQRSCFSSQRGTRNQDELGVKALVLQAHVARDEGRAREQSYHMAPALTEPLLFGCQERWAKSQACLPSCIQGPLAVPGRV